MRGLGVGVLTFIVGLAVLFFRNAGPPRLSSAEAAALVKDNCTGCVNCALVCPDAVITVYREFKKEKKPITTNAQVTQDISLTINELQAVPG